MESLEKRQNGLFEQYSFRCQCEACKLKYPLIIRLPHAKLPSGVRPPIDYDEMDRLAEHDMATALRKIPEYCWYLNMLDPQYPNYEVSSVQEALVKCYHVVYAKKSRKARYKDLCNL